MSINMNVRLNSMSMMADTFFGSKSSIASGSFLSASNFGDLSLMRSGVYTKMLKSYYEQVEGDSDDTEKTSSNTSNKSNYLDNYLAQIGSKPETKTETTANKTLSSVKSTAKTLETAANELIGMNYDESSREDLYKAASKLVDSYNAVVESSAKSDNVSINKSVKWMTDDTKAREKQLNKIGITVGQDGKLSIDEEKFNQASLSDVRYMMEGDSSYTWKISQRATGLYNLAANQISFNSGNTFYSNSGVLK